MQENQPTQQGRNVELSLDTQRVFKSLVQFHENVREMHYDVLSKIGLGEVHRNAWETLERARDAGIEMINRRPQQ